MHGMPIRWAYYCIFRAANAPDLGLRGSSRAVYPVKIEVVSGNGSILTGLLLDSDAEAVFGDASKSEMTFPLSLTATDNTGRVFVSMKLPQPTPAVADEGQAPS